MVLKLEPIIELSLLLRIIEPAWNNARDKYLVGFSHNDLSLSRLLSSLHRSIREEIQLAEYTKQITIGVVTDAVPTYVNNGSVTLKMQLRADVQEAAEKVYHEEWHGVFDPQVGDWVRRKGTDDKSCDCIVVAVDNEYIHFLLFHGTCVMQPNKWTRDKFETWWGDGGKGQAKGWAPIPEGMRP